jgi:glycosyltransferase involved in cell wall biosynthesis
MKIAILGTRGIPNNYGGFEQFAEYISTGLVSKGHEVTVYNPSFHAYKEEYYNGVRLVRIGSPEKWIGPLANFVYDYRCLRHAATQGFDLLYEAGYVTVVPSFILLRKAPYTMLTNMDGLEWKRSKWPAAAKWVIRQCERVTVRKSQVLIADNVGIQAYYKERFGVEPIYLPYGANMVHSFDPTTPAGYGLTTSEYFMLVARLEKENNIEMVLDGYLASSLPHTFLVVGSYQTRYGRYLRGKYASERIRFSGGIYNKDTLDSLRHFSKAYLHGHSVGGTNPSLLEAMASEAFILAHQNQFNQSVLGKNALYFGTREELADIFRTIDNLCLKYKQLYISNNSTVIRESYNWEKVVALHEEVFASVLQIKRF